MRRGTVQNNFTLFQEHKEMAPSQLQPQSFGVCHVVVIDGRVFLKQEGVSFDGVTLAPSLVKIGRTVKELQCKESQAPKVIAI